MLGLYNRGRLGNQLFQYAYLFYLKKKYNIDFYIDEFRSLFYLDKYFELVSFSNIRNRLKRKLYKTLNEFKVLPIEYLNEEIARNQLNFEKIYALQSYFKSFYIEKGFFQTPEYFNQYSCELKKEFKVKDSWRQMFFDEYGELFSNNKVATIHIRKTDYKNSAYELPNEYYLNAVDLIKDQHEYKFLILTDDPDENFEFIETKLNVEIISNNEIIDFLILMESDLLIISNSTFAWWGAFLNNKTNKVVYAPKYWLGYNNLVEYPRGITNMSWNWIK